MYVNNEQNKKINRIIRPIAALIISVVLALMIPILSGVVALPFLLIGQAEAYFVSRFIQNLYGPLVVISCVSVTQLILGWVSFVRQNPINENFWKVTVGLGKNLNKQGFIGKQRIKTISILAFVILLSSMITYYSFSNLIKLTLDFDTLVTSDYKEESGILHLYEVTVGDDTQTRMEVNGIKFVGGNATGETLTEGKKYHVWYLPHTKYVVEYTMIN